MDVRCCWVPAADDRLPPARAYAAGKIAGYGCGGIFSFSSMIAAIILTAIYFVLGLFINVIAAFSITLVLLIAGIIALFIILSKKGKTLLLQIEC